MKTPETSLLDQLSNIIADVMNLHEDDPVISPAAIADEVCQKLSEAIRDLTTHLHVRQIIRSKLRRIRKEASRHRQLAFPDFPLIQNRYPTVDGSGYIKRELMSEADWRTNIDQLSRKGGKFLDHAKQLAEWGRDRFGVAIEMES